MARGWCTKLRVEQAKVFLLTFFAYASLHYSRKAFSTIKQRLKSLQWFGSTHSTVTALSTLDTTFLFTYALGLYASGIVGDRVNLRVAVCVGLVLTALSTLAFAGLGLLRVHSVVPYAVVWGISGIVQSSGWPSNVAVVGNWFAKRERGAVFGIWACNASSGNIIG